MLTAENRILTVWLDPTVTLGSVGFAKSLVALFSERADGVGVNAVDWEGIVGDMHKLGYRFAQEVSAAEKPVLDIEREKLLEKLENI